MSAARIQGNFAALEVQHDVIAKIASGLVRTTERKKDWRSRQEAAEAEELARETNYLLVEFEAAFPHAVDVFFHGYNEADARLVE